MDKFDNLQTNSENRQYYIPMEVTPETIKDFGIDPADVVWTKIGNESKKLLWFQQPKNNIMNICVHFGVRISVNSV